jgi:hypothetical protein
LGRKDARIRKQVQPFHIFDLPTNLDTGFYECDQPLIELTAQHAQTENGAITYIIYTKLTSK